MSRMYYKTIWKYSNLKRRIFLLSLIFITNFKQYGDKTEDIHVILDAIRIMIVV